MRFHVTPKNEPDLGGWSAVRFLRLPLIMAVALGIVLVARGIDTVVRALGGAGALPPLELSAYIVISVFSILDIVVALQLAVRAHRRRQYRRLWRFPVRLPARVADATAQCVDLHQGGAAFIVARDVAELAQRLEFSVECRSIDRGAAPAYGTLTITSRSAVGPAGAMVRVGGAVVWRDAESREAVIAHCYVVEPYLARNRAWTRSATRVPVTITARLGEAESTCVDVSIGGAAFLTPERAWGLHDRMSIELQLTTGERVRGEFQVRNIAPSTAGLVRVGGSAEWSHTAWLARYGTVVHAPGARPRIRRLSPR